MVKIVEKTGSTINSTRKFVWHGQENLEFRDATDAVTQRNFGEGQYVGTTAYFYTRDHLGSIREMFTGGGTVVARYDYDPYGRSTTVLGTTPTDFNFTGLYRHSKSNLDLAVFRAYDPELGRWINRDPIAESGGINLYGYVRNNPATLLDILGLDPYLPNPAWKPEGWNNKWPTGTDARGDYSKNPGTGEKWYPHREDEGHWPHYDNDKNERFPKNCKKPWSNQKQPPYGDQSPTNPWETNPPPPWWQRVLNWFPFFRVPVLVPDPEMWMNPERGRRSA
jgi:RHS repeat-associated protein